MGKDISDSYYQAIMSRIEAEVISINGVFEHQGVKGGGNENVLLDILRKILPKKYGVDTGVVIDKIGNQSRQCDIIIYDSLNYPELFSLTSAKFFPVDFVYATIEIKTTLDKTKLKEAVTNIRSVQSLDYIKGEFRYTPTDPIDFSNPNSIISETKSTTAPLGLIFGYSSTAVKYKTFVDWFQPSIDDIGPSHIFSLDQGFLIDHSEKGIMNFFLPYVNNGCCKDSEGMEIIKRGNKEWVHIEGKSYPLSEVGGKKLVVDQSKVIINFIVVLTEMLANKKLSPNIRMYSNYISENNRTMFTLEDDEIKVWRN